MDGTPALQSRVLKGIPAAPGFAQGRAVFWAKEDLSVPRYTAPDPAAEQTRLNEARAKALEEVEVIQQKAALETHAGEADVFTAHQMFLDDVALLKKVQSSLEGGQNAEAAWMDAIESFANQLAAIPDPTLSARAADIRDVGRRVLGHLLGKSTGELQLDGPSVIVAADLSPSQTVGLDKEKVLAFCTAEGGPTSHTAILAKALGLPAVVALGEQLLSVTSGSVLLVDGNQGEVVVNPDEQRLAAFRMVSSRSNLRKEQALTAAALPAVTQDKRVVEIVANIGGLADAQAAMRFGAEGVGLFRTEFLYLERKDLPSEAEQIQVYRQVFDALGNRPVVVRTLDIGGDKAVSYIGFPEEANPFLGWRAIRMNEGRPDIFQSQVRALLRAAVGVDLRIMVPMVSSIEEVVQTRRMLDEVHRSLIDKGIPCADRVQFGIMVEIPSAALIADRLAPLIDFFSIGTNDLTQYTLAVDRTNSRVAHLASPFHPAVLRLIQMTVQAAHHYGKWVGVCGEFAGEVLAAPVLLGLEVDEFSMAPALIPTVKDAIRKCTQAECKTLAEQAVALSSTTEVIELLGAQAARLNLL
jgi:phosphoenolpyruvate-protein phosphotransferase